jgi:hypothetical protein
LVGEGRRIPQLLPLPDSFELCASVATSSKEVNYYVAILVWPVQNAAAWEVFTFWVMP